MAKQKDETPAEEPVHEIAGGWITERKGTPIPRFLKAAYLGFSLFGLYYLFTWTHGETDHATRGPLVRLFNEMSVHPGMGWIAFVAAILGVYVLGLWWYAFLAKGEDGEG